MTKQPTTKNDVRKIMSTVFKVLGSAASDDVTRKNLNHVYVRRVCEVEGVVTGSDVARLEATDGHALIRVEVPLSFLHGDQLGLREGFYAHKRAAALLAVGAEASPEIGTDDDGKELYTWPKTDQVVPKKTDAWTFDGSDRQGTTAQHYNPTLLADTLAAVGRIAAALSGDKRAIPTRIQLGDGPIAPCRIDVRVVCHGGGMADITAVVMPMRP